jgi:hypothetical protein
MTSRELNRAVARSTGEEIALIAARGFHLLEEPDVEDGPLPMLDWDDVDQERNLHLVPICRRRAA